LLGTACIDTTCTIWDVNTQQAKTQIIAHDKEVYDIGGYYRSHIHLFDALPWHSHQSCTICSPFIIQVISVSAVVWLLCCTIVWHTAFARGKDLFASVGADGSVRMFDLRSLVHSTIIYEVGPVVTALSIVLKRLS
jgi:WD repeat-containing protein 68